MRTFWQSEVKISVLALWLCALSSLFHNMGVGGVWTKSSLCTCQACSEVCEKMSSLWMCYTQICPRFECRDEHTIHTCVYYVLTLNAGPGRGVCVCVCGGAYASMLFVKVTLYSVDVYGRETLSYGWLPMFLHHVHRVSCIESSRIKD